MVLIEFRRFQLFNPKRLILMNGLGVQPHNLTLEDPSTLKGSFQYCGMVSKASKALSVICIVILLPF